METSKRFKLVVILMVMAVGVIPLAGYAWLFAGIPTLTVDSALKRLNSSEQDTILVDVRSSGEYAEMHVSGSYHWPVEHILILESSSAVPMELKGKNLLLLCSSGIRSAQAARKLASIGVVNIYHVRGGIQTWVRIGAEHPDLRFSQMEYEQQSGIIYQPMNTLQQIAVIVSGFGFKPLHMLLSLLLGWVLLRQKAGDLRTLGWGMLIFLAAETACAVNYLFFAHNSYLAEYLHSFGMVVAFGFSIFAIQEGLDERLIKFSAPNKRCAFLDLCKGCIKSGQSKCKARNLFQLGTGMVAILAFLPLTAPLSNASYNTNILGTSYHYCRLLLYQYYESRYLPLVALFLCTLAFAVILVKKDESAPTLSRVFLAGALAGLLFSFFRLVLGLVFREILNWADFWEEITELMFVGSVAAVLWIYRKELLQEPFFRSRSDRVEQNP